jgi:hypothetical protein
MQKDTNLEKNGFVGGRTKGRKKKSSVALKRDRLPRCVHRNAPVRQQRCRQIDRLSVCIGRKWSKMGGSEMIENDGEMVRK